MDSFYDAPRRAPVPTQIEKFLPTPVVPEVSIICTSRTATNKYSVYSSWKVQQNSTDAASNGANILKETSAFSQSQNLNTQNTSQLLKKQVRFESPVLQQRPSLTYEAFNTRKNLKENCVKNCETLDSPKKNNPPLNGIPFEQIYLANVPNRKLDLSLIDLPIKSNKKEDDKVIENEDCLKQTDSCKPDLKKVENEESNTSENKENILPKTYREFLDSQKEVNEENPNDSVTDIFNYKRRLRNMENTRNKISHDDRTVSCKVYENSRLGNDSNFRNHCYSDSRQNNLTTSPKCDRVTQTSGSTSVDNRNIEKIEGEMSNNNSEPTNRDLLKIIAQQNEQLLILQRQVAMLLNRADQPKQIEAAPEVNYLGEKCVTSTQNEMFRNHMHNVNNTPRKQRGLSKFSIDLMTSFEVAIRPQHSKQNFVNPEPRIQEITETESGRNSTSTLDRFDKTLGDTSLHLQEPVQVREMCPSPEPSININMNDYDSSDDDEVSASEIGATFYRNLMGQVNDILRKAQVQTKGDYRDGRNCIDKFKNQTMNRVRDATLKHLRNIGVTIGPIEETYEEVSSVTDGKDYNQAEVSFAVKQLLLKHLPDEQLAKITYKQAQSVPFNKSARPAFAANRPEFSFASVEYMKKYNLINNNKDVKPRDVERAIKAPNPQKPNGPKILDITALKMQPKLL